MIQIQDNRRKVGYKFVKGAVAMFYRSAFRVRMQGFENIPNDGAVVVACNHISNFDPFLVGSINPVRYIHFMAKEELFAFKPLGKLLKFLGAFPVKRGMGDKGAIKHALSVTASGGCLMIFPEGHRSKDGALGAGMPGVAFIARKAGSIIVPVAITGRYRFLSKVSVRVGKPFCPKPEDTNDSLLEKLMSEIRALIEMGPIS